MNTKPFPGGPKILLIPEVGPSPNAKKSFLRLSIRDDELLSKPKVITLLSRLLQKFHETAPSNAIP